MPIETSNDLHLIEEDLLDFLFVQLPANPHPFACIDFVVISVPDLLDNATVSRANVVHKVEWKLRVVDGAVVALAVSMVSPQHRGFVSSAGDSSNFGFASRRLLLMTEVVAVPGRSSSCCGMFVPQEKVARCRGREKAEKESAPRVSKRPTRLQM
ncbi:hypothetical protein EK21DRAFT_85119 [Setomelanomma holmii]|uniref:Uncharacterized protein n=1 Tax=Setomelanomma holmii TaxID=210430 RepID=A0A9P4HK48_9PLEO|nr:hypothetical protein EK21DRAFT_85119 [Setomelanomma holmii]